MRRRTWLGLGLVSAALLAAGGGAIAFITSPAIRDGKLSHDARLVFAGAARALLAGTLPGDERAMSELLDRIDGVIGNLPPPAQEELSQLLTLLATAGGRRSFAGLAPAWHEAEVADIAQALQGMRVSNLSLRRQAYQALHDIVGAAFFSAPSTWAILSYPGPVAL